TWLHGPAAAWWLIGIRLLQAVGGAMIMANSAAILTDAFPSGQRGLALGLNLVAALSGGVIGLVLGGLLAPVSWRLVFLLSEDQPPADRGEQAAEHQPDEHPGEGRHQVE